MKKIAQQISLAILVSTISIPAISQPEHKTTPGGGPGGLPQVTFVAHRLGTDHAEGVTTLDMNGDGYADILSGAYWYENPGPNGGEWKRHQYREVGIVGEFVADCGEWTIDVNHDGAPDVVTAGWQTNGVWWYENPKQQGAEWKKHFITDSYDTEGGALADINGDGVPDLILAHYNHSGLIWIDFFSSRAEGASRRRCRDGRAWRGSCRYRWRRAGRYPHTERMAEAGRREQRELGSGILTGR